MLYTPPICSVLTGRFLYNYLLCTTRILLVYTKSTNAAYIYLHICVFEPVTRQNKSYTTIETALNTIKRYHLGAEAIDAEIIVNTFK
jgi:hypothetical protein